ncbi:MULTISPECIES: hypothetical protein [unclassified Moorena]|nr:MULTISPECIES: hypothetical protein [unclassified Moorena]NEO11257.1 hypothetical protein [Moorena sp. SIO3E8]NEP98830.1 hypothetical protein [Moorena sp. SIO3F7]
MRSLLAAPRSDRVRVILSVLAYSRFPIPDSRLPIADCRLPIPDSLGQTL